MKRKLVLLRPMVGADPTILVMPVLVAFANIWLAAALLVMFCAPVPMRVCK